ncbi:hypothetical protein [Nocardioides sp.]|uniref:hypothetical protein n=1 Tax=Nocardioides sp. TaxID=35761 RepID=UPI002ED9DFBD
MGTFGGRRAVAHASAWVVLSVPLLTGCSTALDQAHSVQTRLGRIEQVTDTSVTTPSAERGAAISVHYGEVTTQRGLSRLLAEIDRVADEADYPAYRLDLRPAEAPGDALVVDDSFIGSDAEPTVLRAWLLVTAALLGDVEYSYEPAREAITVDSGAAIGHDVGEASRVGYGYRDTTWTFTADGATFVAGGRVSLTDVQLLQGVQRSVSSDSLPAPAATWRLERRTDHVLLDLDVELGPPGPGGVTPERVTVSRYGEDVQRLVTAALGAVRVAGLPVWLRLHHRTEEGDDVFGYWVSGQAPVRGRDPLVRGWDRWLADLARSLAS